MNYILSMRSMERLAIFSLIFWPPAIFCRTEELNIGISDDCYQPILNLHYLHCQIGKVNINDSSILFQNDSLYLVDGRCSEKLYVIDISAIYRCDYRSKFVRSLRIRLKTENRRISKRFVSPTITSKSASLYFEQNEYRTSVTEEGSIDHSVIEIKATRNPILGTNGRIFYRMIPTRDSRSSTYFVIDPNTGIVTVKRPLDRETISEHAFRVTAYEPTKNDQFLSPSANFENDQFASTQLVIRVLDVNDHLPIFDKSVYVGSISESVEIGTTVLHVHARDEDENLNGKINYSIDEDETDQKFNDFQLDLETGILKVKRQLDREKVDFYRLTVKACDRGGPMLRPLSSSSSLSSPYFDESSKIKTSGNDQFTISKDQAHANNCGSALVEITVEDENDNYPQFSHVTNVDIDENLDSTARPLIAKISAYDPDLGDNGRIHYSIVSGNGHNRFSLDYKAGEIRLIDKLNHKQMPRYELLIRAQDSGLVPLSNMTLLIINVKDVNDNPPKFYSSFIQETVPEDATPGFSVVRIQAYDSDSGENSRVSYSIHSLIDDEDGPSFLENLPFKIDLTSGWISVVGLLDREKRNSYDFRVKAKDHGTPELFSFIKVNIQVADVNDNPPIFDEKFYNVSVPESAQKGSEILKVTAKDKDETAGRLDYFIISGNDDETFMLLNQADGGLLTVNKKLDYRIQPSYVLSLRVADTGGFFDICQVYVQILDVNSSPYFSEYHLYPIVVSEQEPINSTVAVIRAEDSDDGENARLVYKMEGDRGGDFRIDGVSGAIMINRKLDRETISKYNLIITVLDNGKPPLSTSTELEIVIDDFNDNYPIFQKPNYTISIPEDLPIGTSFLQISANDNDSGQNGRLSYAILNNENDRKDFYVDPSSGVLRVNKSLDREKIAEYNLTLIASDKGSPPLTSSTIVRIILDDINDNAPKFDKDVYDIPVPENSLLESKIFTLKAHDPDYGENAQITFKIFGGSDAACFELVADLIDPNSVDILLKTDLDYESNKKFYNFQVKAESGDLNAIADIRIFVTDVNDHAPILNDFRLIFNNYPGRFRLASSARVPAKDLDVNDTLRFWIADQENELVGKFDPFGIKSLFDVDQFTGFITLKSNLNTNRDVFGKVVVCVSDGANKRCATCQLKVTLITEDILISSVTVRFTGTAASFLDAQIYERFLDALSTLLPSNVDDIVVFSVKNDRQTLNLSESILNVSLTLKRPDADNYVSAGELQELIHLNRQHLSELTHLHILPFDDNLCVREPCLNFERCHHVLKFGEASPHFEVTDTMLFRSIHPINTFICTCPEGYAGMKKPFLCDTEINLCYSSPCGPNGTCISRENGYNCLCPPNYTGRNCEFPLSTEFCAPGLCSGSSHCKFSNSNIIRIAGPLKNVQQKGLNTQKSTVECTNCPYDRQFSNKFCQLTTRSFFYQSFVTFPPIKQRNRFEISLKFSTVKSDGLIFYNGRYQLEDDFLAMSLRKDNLVVYISLGSPKIEEVIFPAQRGEFSDGSWHTVLFRYYNRTMTLSVDGCDERIALMKSLARTTPNCAVEKTIILDRRCQESSVACYRLLDLTGPLYVGGLPHNAKNFRMDPTLIPSFSGCIADFSIDGSLLDMNRYVTNVGSLEGCRWMENLCSGKQPCVVNRSRSCHNIWNSYKCNCLDGFGGQNCSSIVDEPIHFQSDDAHVEYNFKSKFETSFVFGLSVRITAAENHTSPAIIYALEFGTGRKLSAFLAPGAKLCINFGDQEFQADIYNHRLIFDDLWFTIIIVVNDNELIVNIDYVNVTNFALNEIFHDKMTKISIGSESHRAKAFTGCVKGVFIGRTLHEPEYLSVKHLYNVKRNCPRPDNCLKCPKNAKCDAKKSKCQCLPGVYGPNCQFEVCSKHFNPCLNGARCQRNNASVFHCECLFGFWGDRCQFRDPLATNGGRCPKTWFGHYPLCVPCKCDPAKNNDQDCDKVTGQCYCKPYHYKKAPNSDICLPCKCHFPTGASTLMCNDFTGQCKCKNRIKGIRCTECSRKNEQINRKIGKCETVKNHCPESFHSDVLWPRASFNTTVTVRCPKEMSGYAQRTCVSDTVLWTEPMLINCTSKRFEYLNDMLNQIESTSLQLNSYLSQQIASYLNNLTSKSLDTLYGRDLHITHNLLVHLIEEELKPNVISHEYSHAQDKKFIKNIVASSSEILKQDVAKLWLQNYDHEPTTEVLKQVELLEKYGTFFAKSISTGSLVKPFRIDSENIIFVIDTVNQDFTDVLRLPKYDNIVVNQQRNGNGHNVVKAEMDMARDQQISTAFYAIYSSIDDLLFEFEYYSYESSQSHQPTVKRLISPILSLSLLNNRGNKIERLKQPIRISFDMKGKSISTENNIFCAWLKAEKVIEWVPDGCNIWSKNETHVTCSCDHLSTFAIVSRENTDLEAFSGDLFRYFDAILPILWTLVLVLIFVHRRYRLKRGMGSFGYLSHYIIMFISMNYVATVLGYSFSTSIARHQTACSWTYLLLQYVFSSLFLWLVIWPVHLYRKVAELKNAESRFLWIYVFFGQGISTFVCLLYYTHIDAIPFRKPIFRCARIYRHPAEWIFIGLIVIAAFISCCLHILCIAICRIKSSNSKKPIRLDLKVELIISFCFDIMCILNFALINFSTDTNLRFTSYVYQTISSLTFCTIIAFVYIDGKKFAEKQGFWKNKTEEMMTSKSVGDTSTDDPSAVVSHPGSPDDRLSCDENAEHPPPRRRFASPSLAAKNSLKNRKSQRSFRSTTPNFSPLAFSSSNDEDGEMTPLTLGQKGNGRRRVEYNDLNVEMSTPVLARRDLAPGKRCIASFAGERQDKRPDLIPSWDANQELRLLAKDIDAAESISLPVYSIVNKKDIRQASINNGILSPVQKVLPDNYIPCDNDYGRSNTIMSTFGSLRKNEMINSPSSQQNAFKKAEYDSLNGKNSVITSPNLFGTLPKSIPSRIDTKYPSLKKNDRLPPATNSNHEYCDSPC